MALPVSVSFDFKFKKDRMLTLTFGEQTTLIEGWPLREFFPFLLKSQREKYISKIENKRQSLMQPMKMKPQN